mmetsp:Transcript_32255/g.44746  ORF Transcript_32255/g.44746 Transcript_32255/m.44746 type:complete len:191 (-) Transcript_32255:210-782(-)
MINSHVMQRVSILLLIGSLPCILASGTLKCTEYAYAGCSEEGFLREYTFKLDECFAPEVLRTRMAITDASTIPDYHYMFSSYSDAPVISSAIFMDDECSEPVNPFTSFEDRNKVGPWNAECVNNASPATSGQSYGSIECEVQYATDVGFDIMGGMIYGGAFLLITISFIMSYRVYQNKQKDAESSHEDQI